MGFSGDLQAAVSHSYVDYVSAIVFPGKHSKFFHSLEPAKEILSSFSSLLGRASSTEIRQYTSPRFDPGNHISAYSGQSRATFK